MLSGKSRGVLKINEFPIATIYPDVAIGQVGYVKHRSKSSNPTADVAFAGNAPSSFRESGGDSGNGIAADKSRKSSWILDADNDALSG